MVHIWLSHFLILTALHSCFSSTNFKEFYYLRPRTCPLWSMKVLWWTSNPMFHVFLVGNNYLIKEFSVFLVTEAMTLYNNWKGGREMMFWQMLWIFTEHFFALFIRNSGYSCTARYSLENSTNFLVLDQWFCISKWKGGKKIGFLRKLWNFSSIF